MVNINSSRIATGFVFILIYAALAMAQPFDLRPKFIEGQELTFSETQNIKITSDYMPGSDQSFVLKSVFTQKVEEVTEEGDIRLTITIRQSQLEGETRPPQRMDYANLIGFPITVLLDSQLRVKKISPPQNLPESAQYDYSRFKQLYYNLSPDSQIPDRLIAVGESWNNHQTVSYEFMTAVFDQIQKLRSTLKEETLFSGRPSFVIDFEGNFSGSISEGMNGTIEGTFNGQRTMDKESGQDIQIEMEITQNMHVITDLGDMNYQIGVSLVRQLANEDAVAIQ